MTSSRNRPEAAAATVLLLLALCSAPARGVDFAGGTGEPNDPYQIATFEQLLAMDDDPNLYDKHFTLIADIDLDPTLPGRDVFLGPVLYWRSSTTRAGRGSIPFSGYFDGNGHAICNAVVYHTNSYSYAALFDSVGESGRIHNLRLENIVIAQGTESGGYCGALAGLNSGFVVNCSATGTILGGIAESPPPPAGGLIGYNSGFVVDCNVGCHVFGALSGGLVGENDRTGRIVFCSSTGTVIGDETAGGLVAGNAGTIQYSCAEGSVLGFATGGLVGTNGGTVRESYAAALTSWAGLVGTNSGVVTNCYAMGTVTSPSANAGGLIAMNEATVVSCYSITVLEREGAEPEPLPFVGASSRYDVRQNYSLMTEASVTTRRRGPSTRPTITALSAEEMRQQASFPGLDFVGDANDGTEDHWFMPEDSYPVLAWQREETGLAGIPNLRGLDLERGQELLRWTGFAPVAVSHDYARPQKICEGWDCYWLDATYQILYTRPAHYALPGSPVEIVISLGSYDFSNNPGDGSAAHPYQIATGGQLDALYEREDLWASHFTLTADIDLRYQSYARPLIEEFAGSFNGNGHSVRYRGQHNLFGIIRPDAVVHDLVLESVQISAFPEFGNLGLLAERNEGRTERCAASGRILGGAVYVGGLVGYNVGEIINCRTHCQILPETTADYVGGLAGINYGPDAHIEACYAQGSVRGAACVGGLVGANVGRAFRRINSLTTADDPVAVVRNCYTSCSVTGQDDVGGGIGLLGAIDRQEGCYFLGLDGGGGPDNGYGTALSAAQMRRQASFVGWDFENTWTICEGSDYPHLRWEDVVCEP